MRFTKTIGSTDDPKIKEMVRKAEEKLSSVFTELSLGYDNKTLGTFLGGDPLIFQLVYPLPHYCDLTAVLLDQLEEKDEAKQKEIEEKIARGEPITEEGDSEEAKKFRATMRGRVLRTAATNGSSYYWNPEFINKLSKIGLRLVAYHEAAHALFLHPSRRGARMHKLWNIAVDYRVNFTAMEDLKSRDVKDYPVVFEKELGLYIRLEEYASFLKDPFNPPARLAHFNPIHALKSMADPAYKHPGDDSPPMYYADHELSSDMKRPENVYEYLLAQIPKCPKCGKLGKYKKPEEYKQLQKKVREQQKKEAEKKKKEEDKKKQAAGQKPDPTNNGEGEEEHKCCNDHDHEKEPEKCCNHGGQSSQPQNSPGQTPGSNGQPDPNGQPGPNGEPQKGEEGSCCGDGCSECGGDDSEYVDPFGAGETLDEHMDSDVGEDALAKRITDAMEIAKRMGGKVPGGLEDELGILISPTIRWEDLLRAKMQKKRNGYGRNDWNHPKSRPLFAGIYKPQKRDFFLNILCAYDCSGSMSAEDVAYIISQMQVVDERGEIYLVGWDVKVAWETMVKIKKADKENLSTARRVGLGGTDVRAVFEEYEKHCGKVDIIVIGTDGFLSDVELRGVKVPSKDTDVLWLVSSHNPGFRPPFGRILHLRNEKL